MMIIASGNAKMAKYKTKHYKGLGEGVRHYIIAF
jgi:hypothetical protein